MSDYTCRADRYEIQDMHEMRSHKEAADFYANDCYLAEKFDLLEVHVTDKATGVRKVFEVEPDVTFNLYEV